MPLSFFIKTIVAMILLYSSYVKASEELPKLKWSKVAGAKQYAFQLAEDEDFKNIIKEGLLNEAEFAIGAEIEPGKYYLRVASIDEEGRRGDFSPPLSLDVEAIRTTQLKLYEPQKPAKVELPIGEKEVEPAQPINVHIPRVFVSAAFDLDKLEKPQTHLNGDLGVAIYQNIYLGAMYQKTTFTHSTSLGKEITFDLSRTGITLLASHPTPLWGHVLLQGSAKLLKKIISFEINHFSNEPTTEWDIRFGGGIAFLFTERQSMRFSAEMERKLGENPVTTTIKPQYTNLDLSYRGQVLPFLALEPYVRTEIESFVVGAGFEIEKDAAPLMGLRILLSI